MKKTNDFFEHYQNRTARSFSTPRAFGLTFSIFFMAIGIIKPSVAMVVIGLVLTLVSFVMPNLLAWPNRGWARLALALNTIVEPAFLALFFYLFLTPMAYLLRLVKYDPMKRTWESDAKSYWLDVRGKGQSSSMREQF